MEHTYSFFSSSADESDLDRALPSVRGTDAVMGARPPAVSRCVQGPGVGHGLRQ